MKKKITNLSFNRIMTGGKEKDESSIKNNKYEQRKVVVTHPIPTKDKIP